MRAPVAAACVEPGSVPQSRAGRRTPDQIPKVAPAVQRTQLLSVVLRWITEHNVIQRTRMDPQRILGSLTQDQD